ncbi:MAG TPA: hypothetical protein PLE33_00060 [Candidatus Cloacimonas sp.]|nr:hypothetical protein [Candidatus Cloacimonas sp.]HPS59639.1 hypothetical protein [Candidatus Cloacimonas sp.]
MNRRNLKRKNGILVVPLTTSFFLYNEFCGNERTSQERAMQTSLYRGYNRKNDVLVVPFTTSFFQYNEFCGNEITSQERAKQTSFYRGYQ